MATTANQLLDAMDPGRLRAGKIDALVTLYEGTLCFREGTSGASEGYITDVSDSGANAFQGIVKDYADNSAGDAGDHDCEYYTEGAYVLPVAGALQQQVGDPAYATDNWTVTPSSTNASLIGRFVEYIDSTHMRVDIHTHDTDLAV